MAAGGAERVASTLANAWSVRGDKVWIVPTFLGDVHSAYPLHSDISLVRLRISASGLLQPFRPLLKIRALRALVRSISPDVVVSFLTNVNALALVALRSEHIPVIVSERVDPAARVEIPWYYRAARTVLYRFAAALVVQTSAAGESYRAAIIRPPRIWVIGNPLPQSLHLSSTRADLLSGKPHVVAMGRLVPQKRFDLLIRAFDRAVGDEKAWTMAIWGDGPDEASLQRLIEELGLQSRVFLRGPTNEPWKELASGRIFALTSAYEGFPNAMLEAMALGLPCVAFDCPSGPSDLAANGSAAVLVQSGDVGALASELKKLASDPDRQARLGREAATSVRARFSEETITAKWDELFDAVDPG